MNKITRFSTSTCDGFNSGMEGCLTCLNTKTCKFVETGDMKYCCLEDGELKGYQADVELINRIKSETDKLMSCIQGSENCV